MALNWCCCCVSLRTGALTLAILYLVVNVGVVLSMTGVFFATLAYYSTAEAADDYHHYRRTIQIEGFILGVVLVMCGLNITMDSLLVHGIRRNRRKLILPWVIWYGIFTSLVTVTLISVWIWLLDLYIQVAERPSEGTAIIAVFLITIGCVAALSLPVMWYWYACVVSYYQVLAPSDLYAMEALREPGPHGAPTGRRPTGNTAS